MHLTAFTDYSLRTLMYLALRPNRLVTIAEIAGANGISANHLMKVVHQLALAGDVATVRGQHGGLRLARRPEHINLAVVVRRTEARLAPAPCFEGEQCAVQGACILEDALETALLAFTRVLETYSLADLVHNRVALCGRLGIRDNADRPEDTATPDHKQACSRPVALQYVALARKQPAVAEG